MRNQFYKTQPMRGSHLPVLIKLMSITDGPVLEMGCGMYSTPFLHWACYPSKRELVTIETKPEYFDFIEQFKTDYHKVWSTDDVSLVDLSGKWSVAFVDHAPDNLRWLDILRLSHAEYVVAHDADNATEGKYHYRRTHGEFLHRWKYSDAYPKTAVFSNFHDLKDFTV